MVSSIATLTLTLAVVAGVLLILRYFFKLIEMPQEEYYSTKLLIQRHKRRNLMKVDRNEGLYGVYYDVNGDRMGEAEIVDTNDYYGF